MGKSDWHRSLLYVPKINQRNLYRRSMYSYKWFGIHDIQELWTFLEASYQDVLDDNCERKQMLRLNHTSHVRRNACTVIFKLRHIRRIDPASPRGLGDTQASQPQIRYCHKFNPSFLHIILFYLLLDPHVAINLTSELPNSNGFQAPRSTSA